MKRNKSRERWDKSSERWDNGRERWDKIRERWDREPMLCIQCDEKKETGQYNIWNEEFLPKNSKLRE